MTVKIVFSYTSDAAVLAALKEFHVFAVDPTTKARLTTAIVLTSVPTLTSPVNVSVNGYGAQMVEVVPVDKQGTEGITTYASVYVPLPAVSAVAQVTA